MVSTLRFSGRTRHTLSLRCLLVIQLLFLSNSLATKLEDPKDQNNGNSRILRKRINENGDVVEESNNHDASARQYLETLWDSVEQNYERKLVQGRMPYLESVMGMLTMSMSMSMPTKLPSSKPPVLPGTPTEFLTSKEPTMTSQPPVPSRNPIAGPTLPTRVPIPTRAPISAPSVPSNKPVEVPTPTKPSTPAPVSPSAPCNDDVKKFFLMETLSSVTDKSILLDDSTPQGMAYSFLLGETASFVCTPTLMQRYGLSTFFFATAGTDWTDSTGWLGRQQECNWYGVKCNEDSFATSLNLAVNNVNGMIPDEISVLSTLQKLDLFSNSVIGTLPDGLSGLSNLATLDLQKNFLTGAAFPSSIIGLHELKSYRISSNQLAGTLPHQMNSLRKLSELWAGNNLLSGSIPSQIGNLRDLKTIYINNNALTGSIPTELGLIPLEGLVMNDNSFFNTIPSQLFNVASLNTVRLDNNFFEGTLPNSIGQLTDLESFRVENNNLSGQIPHAIGDMTSLVSLRLNDNFWSGTIPDVFANYRQLDFFDVSNTVLGGSIPKSIFAIPTLRLAYMSNSKLVGSIPIEYALAPQLRDLYLNGNDLTGAIPEIAAGQLPMLNEFLLQNNRISGPMPESICRLRSEFILDDLWTDCGGPSPEVDCDFPECCNRCFESETVVPSRN
mmetsp:Transcript_25085/g.59207  ORF Transcript_25085/g.59207 Transcript_25085/m.59207 type:complete len:670 (+) Transcript_25085:79-2088(+)